MDLNSPWRSVYTHGKETENVNPDSICLSAIRLVVRFVSNVPDEEFHVTNNDCSSSPSVFIRDTGSADRKDG
ncbi:hypothetical protein CesoFtcFv8_015604 [Champsocephalus esox]|uniref:Uncharacterized protein n=1 Tax=Champsocephalus esox TaxID=159716 RepID=A0AAN8GT16_9TELE|nr:hypothetical protein CesoFtcFv8_015604 [Champsocephalus esox]